MKLCVKSTLIFIIILAIGSIIQVSVAVNETDYTDVGLSSEQPEWLVTVWIAGDAIYRIGGWLFSVGLVKQLLTFLTVSRIQVSNVRYHYIPRRTQVEDLLTLQYRIKNTSHLGWLNPLPKSIQDYTYGYWLKQGFGVYKVKKSLSHEEFFIPYDESIDAIQPIEMSFTSNTDYTMILHYQMDGRVLCNKSIPIHIDEVPEKEDWVYNQDN